MKRRNFLPRTRISPMHGLWFMALVAMMIFLPVNSYSGLGVIELPKTGQTTSYYPGDDGDLQMGIDWNPATRFTDNFDGTVTDNLTGLMWLQNGGTPTISTCTGGTKNWDAAHAYAYCLNGLNGGLGYASHNDWRPANFSELESLVNAGQNNTVTWLNSLAFTNVQTAGYWVSNHYAGLAGMRDYLSSHAAWYIELSQGDTFYNWYYNEDGGKDALHYVWPVRCVNEVGGVCTTGSVEIAKTRDEKCTYKTASPFCSVTTTTPCTTDCNCPKYPPTEEGCAYWLDDPECDNITYAGSKWELQDGWLRKGVDWPDPRFTNIDGSATKVCSGDLTSCINKSECSATKYCSIATSTTCTDNADCPAGESCQKQSCMLTSNVLIDQLTGLMWTRSGNVAGNTVRVCKADLTTCTVNGDCSTAQRYCSDPDYFDTPCVVNLSWNRSTDCPGTNKGCSNQTCVLRGPITSWQLALDYIADMNNETNVSGYCATPCPNFGYTDWRLANRAEMLSLTRHGKTGRAWFVNEAGFAPSIVNCLYWTSSTDPSDDTEAYVYEVESEGMWRRAKAKTPRTPQCTAESYYLLPVRTPVPDISSDPASFDFGPVDVGATSAPQTFTISNDGNNDLVIGTLSITGADASDFNIVALSDNCSNTTVTPTNSCTVDVECSPTLFGARSADLSIPSNDPDENPLLVGLDCTGAEPDISASPGSFNCGAMNLWNTTAVPITVSNDGNADLIIGAIPDPPAGDTGEFTWDFSNCSGQTVGAGNSCVIDVECAPVTEGGPWCIDISIPSNDPDEDPLVIDVCVTGVLGAAPDLIVSDLSIPKVKKNRRGHIAKIFVDYKVMNQGNGDAVPSKLGVYLSRDTVLDAGDTYIGSANIPSLAPGEETPRLLRAKRFKLRPPVSSSGTWYVLGKADDNDDNTELDENNNVTPTLITGSGR